jgi:hypothetical protein
MKKFKICNLQYHFHDDDDGDDDEWHYRLDRRKLPLIWFHSQSMKIL